MLYFTVAKKCTASLCTDLSMEYYIGELPKIQDHNCGPPDEDKFMATSVVSEMRQEAATSARRPSSILGKRLLTISDSVAAKLPKTDSLKRSLRRSKQIHRPKEPASLEELSYAGTHFFAINSNDVLNYCVHSHR